MPTPYEEGFRARTLGETLHQNPYTNWTQVHGEWNDGWRAKDSEDGQARTRISMEQGCPTCAELARGSFGPSHDPSPRCESGKRPHCTCDICF